MCVSPQTLAVLRARARCRFERQPDAPLAYVVGDYFLRVMPSRRLPMGEIFLGLTPP